ncbi:MAG: Holliday junction branch migration protein RuvA [Rikenellaceae bacterium]|nr:Holliday junction branch migration protein RuvA [Rikenellaceae bacterium]
MLDYISGNIAELTPTRIVIDNHGMGYGIEISLQSYELLQGKEQVKIYIHEAVNQRDATQVFYGFASKDERALFELIIGVSGIGAASARMILSSISADELREAILSENVAKIKSIKGIGVKSAQRLILELKDKIVKGEGSNVESIFKSDNNAEIDEATSALTMLGFSKPNINKAIQSIVKSHPDAKVEEIIKMALKIL